MFKVHCFPKEIILQAVYFKLRFSLSYRDIEELLYIRGIRVDHATVQRWVYKFTPLIEGRFRKGKKPVGISWRMDETYIKVKGEWMYFYRAVKAFIKMAVLKSLTLIKAERIKKTSELTIKGALRESKCANVSI